MFKKNNLTPQKPIPYARQDINDDDINAVIKSMYVR